MDKHKEITKVKIGAILEKVNLGDGYADIDSLADEIYHIAIPEGAVVLTMEEYQKYLAFKIIEPQVRGCLDRERILEKRLEIIGKETAEKFAEKAKERFTKAKNAYKGASQTVIYHDKMMFHKGEERAMEKAIQFVDEIEKGFTENKNEKDT